MNWQDQAKELWGEHWKRTLALTAGVTKRTAQRWATGEITIKPSVINKINATYEIWRKDLKKG